MSALFSSCGHYRYRLTRSFQEGQGTLLYIGLNPSTADETHNDPTIRRCINFAKSWGYNRLVVVNLFSFRATLPSDLKTTQEPNGPENNQHLLQEAQKASRILVGWGVHGTFLGRDKEVLELLRPFELSCLGRTKAGMPRHPLYIRADTLPQPYSLK